MGNLMQEFRFALHDRVVVITLIIAGLLSIFTIVSGLKEIVAERALIERVERLVIEDREIALTKQSDPGGAAYYAFHFTYDPPSALAFTSRGVRDDLPWKHRIRMLALEGQIYETDVGNPELSRVGKLDFSFVAAFLLPLLSILLLHDLRAGEQRNNRWAFLSATSGDGRKLLRNRVILRSTLLYFCAAIPLFVGAIISGASILSTVTILGAVAFNVIFWSFLALFITSRIEAGPTAAALLLGVWFLLAVAFPIGGKLAVENAVIVPKGGEILLSQREAVNDAWDLPKEATMKPFVDRHPQWADGVDVNLPFEWKWYYAFQQVGDQTVEKLSQDLRGGIANRDKAMGIISLVSPPLLTERLLAKAADTNVASFQRYDTCVRNFHEALRDFHYPMFFGQTSYSAEVMAGLPTYVPCSLSG